MDSNKTNIKMRKEWLKKSSFREENMPLKNGHKIP